MLYTALSAGCYIPFHIHFPVQRWFYSLWCTLPSPKVALFSFMYTSLSEDGSLSFDVHFPFQRWFCSLWCTLPCPKVVLFPLMYTSLPKGGSIPFDVHIPVQRWSYSLWCTLPCPKVVLFPLMYTSLSKRVGFLMFSASLSKEVTFTWHIYCPWKFPSLHIFTLQKCVCSLRDMLKAHRCVLISVTLVYFLFSHFDLIALSSFVSPEWWCLFEVIVARLLCTCLC